MLNRSEKDPCGGLDFLRLVQPTVLEAGYERRMIGMMFIANPFGARRGA